MQLLAIIFYLCLDQKLKAIAKNSYQINLIGTIIVHLG